MPPERLWRREREKKRSRTEKWQRSGRFPCLPVVRVINTANSRAEPVPDDLCRCRLLRGAREPPSKPNPIARPSARLGHAVSASAGTATSSGPLSSKRLRTRAAARRGSGATGTLRCCTTRGSTTSTGGSRRGLWRGARESRSRSSRASWRATFARERRCLGGSTAATLISSPSPASSRACTWRPPCAFVQSGSPSRRSWPTSWSAPA